MFTVDEKYIVFKRDEWNAFLGEDVPGMQEAMDFEDHQIHGAVVIRTQDIFAGPALHAYASSVQTALEILEAEDVVLGGDVVSRLNKVRDYFFDAALEADDHRLKKVPD